MTISARTAAGCATLGGKLEGRRIGAVATAGPRRNTRATRAAVDTRSESATIETAFRALL